MIGIGRWGRLVLVGLPARPLPAAPGPRGVAWAFARAGASVIAAAQGRIDDAAAARWSERFYAALGNGRSFSQAAGEAEKDSPAARFIVVK